MLSSYEQNLAVVSVMEADAMIKLVPGLREFFKTISPIVVFAGTDLDSQAAASAVMGELPGFDRVIYDSRLSPEGTKHIDPAEITRFIRNEIDATVMGLLVFAPVLRTGFLMRNLHSKSVPSYPIAPGWAMAIDQHGQNYVITDRGVRPDN